MNPSDLPGLLSDAFRKDEVAHWTDHLCYSVRLCMEQMNLDLETALATVEREVNAVIERTTKRADPYKLAILRESMAQTRVELEEALVFAREFIQMNNTGSSVMPTTEEIDRQRSEYEIANAGREDYDPDGLIFKNFEHPDDGEDVL